MSGEDEQNCKYVSMRGIAGLCSINTLLIGSGITENDFSKVKSRDTIFVALESLQLFYSFIDSIPNEFILVTGNIDKKSPKDFLFNQKMFEQILVHPKIIHCYSQYGEIENKKFTRLPIGLDYHTLTQNIPSITAKHQDKYYIEEIRRRAQPLSNRMIKCYGNFQFKMDNNKHGYERQKAFDTIPKEIVYYEPRRTTKYEAFLRQCQYTFVISPAGKELDCHRTWEALCLGCIPIVKSSAIDSLYDDLPVLIVNDWYEITLELLCNTFYKVINTQYNYDKLTLKYWMDKINEYKTQEQP